ncbi:MAG TPA: type II toxin-antitoxin system HicB family antitoxin [Hanamia sp.]
MEYLVIFEQAPDGTIWAKVPDLDGCYSSGDTIDQAKENVKNAIALYIEDLKKDEKLIPKPTLSKAELVTV